MKLAIRYVSRYTYDGPVGESQNALRVKPATTPSQTLRDYRLATDPKATVVSYEDYWGTHVDMFGINEWHTRLTIVADSNVETAPPPQPPADLPAEPGHGADVYEYLMPSPHVYWDDALDVWAREVTAGLERAQDRALAVYEAVASHLSYQPDSTDVGTSVGEIFANGTGVCQDYSHLALAAYRSLAIPARYVSGYFYATPTGDQPTDEEIEVETHAWVEVLLPGFGWWGLDPTNRQLAGERHVKIGHGRDYEDVTPLRGVYHGPTESSDLTVDVKMSRAELATHVVESQPVYQQAQQQQQQQ